MISSLALIDDMMNGVQRIEKGGHLPDYVWDDILRYDPNFDKEYYLAGRGERFRRGLDRPSGWNDRTVSEAVSQDLGVNLEEFVASNIVRSLDAKVLRAREIFQDGREDRDRIEVLGIVGHRGSGKSSLARCLNEVDGFRFGLEGTEGNDCLAPFYNDMKSFVNWQQAGNGRDYPGMSVLLEHQIGSQLWFLDRKFDMRLDGIEAMRENENLRAGEEPIMVQDWAFCMGQLDFLGQTGHINALVYQTASDQLRGYLPRGREIGLSIFNHVHLDNLRERIRERYRDFEQDMSFEYLLFMYIQFAGLGEALLERGPLIFVDGNDHDFSENGRHRRQIAREVAELVD